MADSKTSAELLADLKASPGDDKLRESAARALLSEGDVEGSFKTLTERLINVTAHAKGSPLPSLHRKAIKPAQTRVEADGESFVRDFVCAQGRVLFFWVPEALGARSDEIRDAVREKLDAKMKSYDSKRGRGRDSGDDE
jgi:hypothetical protein